MAHRFAIGTQYQTQSKQGRKIIWTLHTVEDQMTVTNAAGVIVKEYYTTSHMFMGQKVVDHMVYDTTIARNIVK